MAFFDHLSFPKTGITLVAAARDAGYQRYRSLSEQLLGAEEQQWVRTMDSSTCGLVSRLVINVLSWLRLDELVSVEIDWWYRGEDVWTALGNLPHIKELKVVTPDLDAIQALCPHSPAHQVFPALMTLTVSEWVLNPPRFSSSPPDEDLRSIEKLLHCVKLRAEARIPLKSLRIERVKV
ncbi:hypothetical protein H0H92_008206 [Tricholoma furcatifolium]|nr:hypothetical protein H0H92_008206 [Tricholoma furcatifolium]